jgi:hypothetical protein
MKGEGIFEFYRQQAEAAALRSKPQPAQTWAPAWLDGVV